MQAFLIVGMSFGTLFVTMIDRDSHAGDKLPGNGPLVLGADGGGTKTVGILASLDGTELVRHQVGPGNPNVAGMEGAAETLRELICTCCDKAGRHVSELGAIVLGLAGVGSDAIRARLADALKATFRKNNLGDLPVTIETDARIGLEGAFEGGYGVVLIAGTGSIVIGKVPPGTVSSVGGWGRVLGDEGSGYFLGVEALKAVARDMDGREDATYLRTQLAERHGWTSRSKIIAAVYQDKIDIPSLAPIVLHGASHADPVCERILRTAAHDIVAQLAVLARRMGPQHRVGVVLVGGLIDHDTPYTRILRDTIEHTLPQVEVSMPLHPPVWGAVLMAMHIIRSRSAAQ